MSNKKIIEESLKSLILDDNRAFVAMLSGEWGIGKTYFWHEFTKSDLKDKNVAYISLFGHNSLQDIKTNIIMTLSKTEKGKAIVGELLNSFRTSLGAKDGDSSSGLSLSGSVVNSLISLIPEKDLQNTVICFDDFERLSDKVALKDVMGLISQFKEQKECKIVMILNEGELSKENNKVFSTYKEKIVDYNFRYMPSQEEELFKAIKEDVKKITFCEHETIYDFFKKIDLKNIRIMKQALYLLKKFSFIEAKAYDKKVIDEFVEIALNLFVFNITSNFSYQKLQKFKLYKTELLSESLFPDNKKLTRNADFNKYLNSYHDIPYYLTNDDMEKIIYTFITTHMIDKDAIKNLLKVNNTNLDKNHIRDNIFKFYNMARFNFKSSVQDCAKNIFTLLDENSHLIPYILTLEQLNQYLLFIEEHTKLISKEFKDTYIKKYITLKPTHQGYQGEFNYERYKKFLEIHYPHLLYFLSNDQSNSLISTLTINELNTLLNKVNHSFGPKDQYVLNNTLPKTYKKYIKESDEFYESVISFLRDNHDGFFNIGIQNMKQALIELSKENKDNEWRILQLLKETNIKLEENS